METVGAVIVAAGRSVRMGADKIWLPIGRASVLAHTLAAFARCGRVGRVALVLSPDSIDRGKALLRELGIDGVTCTGGRLRQDSVRLGLEALGPCDRVIVHDGARPFVTVAMIEQALEATRPTGAATAAVPAKDTIKMVEGERVRMTLPRSDLWLTQTPQAFRYDLLWEAHHASRAEVTDDASLLEHLGHPVVVFPGSYDNIKITTPEDLELAALIYRRRARTEASRPIPRVLGRLVPGLVSFALR